MYICIFVHITHTHIYIYIYIYICYSPLLKNISVRQAVIDQWFPLIRIEHLAHLVHLVIYCAAAWAQNAGTLRCGTKGVVREKKQKHAKEQ